MCFCKRCIHWPRVRCWLNRYIYDDLIPSLNLKTRHSCATTTTFHKLISSTREWILFVWYMNSPGDVGLCAAPFCRYQKSGCHHCRRKRHRYTPTPLRWTMSRKSPEPPRNPVGRETRLSFDLGKAWDPNHLSSISQLMFELCTYMTIHILILTCIHTLKIHTHINTYMYEHKCT